jgi:hypothetical protein
MERLEAMAADTRGDTWDLSEKDRAAIASVLRVAKAAVALKNAIGSGNTGAVISATGEVYNVVALSDEELFK